ncbi:XRE family transcriptional regulator [Hymenobacter sediminis]|uniref:helix-turn-helix domain-containing protein n=1 Tax=Hymenobacter sediminis TaxID=2218621 RepID=UPI000DA68085|nr:helix-turn-helix transcriptional regulator [Hymenobacter sediminis]RPD50015.1 XRE family transcriptional regulator [Hymenobacter sediminis]
MDHIGSRIKALREELGLTQADLFRSTGIKQTTLSSIESGTEPKAGIVSSLLAAYPQVNPEWLLLGSGPMLRNGRSLVPVEASAPKEMKQEQAPYLSHTTLTPEQIGQLLIKVAALEARAEAAEREAARYWSVVERHAGKKTEGNRPPAATEPEAVYTMERTPIGWQPAARKEEPAECKVFQLVPVEESVSVTPSYARNEKLA